MIPMSLDPFAVSPDAIAQLSQRSVLEEGETNFTGQYGNVLLHSPGKFGHIIHSCTEHLAVCSGRLWDGVLPALLPIPAGRSRVWLKRTAGQLPLFPGFRVWLTSVLLFHAVILLACAALGFNPEDFILCCIKLLLSLWR